MTLQIGAEAPDFEADTTQGRIDFHLWIGDAWCVLFSHPKDDGRRAAGTAGSSGATVRHSVCSGGK